MKKIKFLLIFALFAATALTSCDNSDGDYPRYTPLITTVHPLGNGDFYFQRDNGETLYPGDKSRIGAYDAKEGQRAIIWFNLMDKIEGYTYQIALYGIENIYTGSTATVSTQEALDALGDAQNSFVGSVLSDKYLTLQVAYPVSDNTKHTFTLVRNNVTDPEYKYDGYLNLELRHNDGGDTGYNKYCYLSFDLTDFKAELEGKKGITLRVKTQMNGVKYICIDMSKDE